MYALALENIKKEFLDGKEVKTIVKDVDFFIEPGKFVAIIGPSGSGKSTLLTIAGGLQRPTEGSVTINGTDFYAASQKKRGQIRFNEVGFILQSSNLIPYLTIEEQFILIDKVKKSKTDKIALQSLFEQLDILHLAKKYPSDISGGERQRVAIAKALYNNPSIILADEPTASLDSTRAYEVVKILSQEAKAKNKATIMITHDKRMVEYCDEVYEMNDGEFRKIKPSS